VAREKPKPPPPPAPKREVAQAAPAAKPSAPVETKPATERSAPVEARPAAAPPAAAASTGVGRLTLGAKPPCSVLINGQDTGQTTPVRDLEVKSGSLAVTLVNSEFGIRESFTVNVAPGESKKVIKDFSDRLPR
jgi:hypothetical protein